MQHSVRDFHEFLGKPSLIFNLPFLNHEDFHAYMCQLIDVFVYRVQFDGYEAQEVFVANVHKLTRHYGIHHAFRRRKKLSLLVNLLDKCNSFNLLAKECRVDGISRGINFYDA